VYELTVYHCTATKQLSFRSSSWQWLIVELWGFHT
jgi:hypothetical protein